MIRAMNQKNSRIIRSIYLLVSLLVINATISSGQVKVRLFTNFNTDTVVFTVMRGEYKIGYFPDGTVVLNKGQKGIIIKSGTKLVIKTTIDHFWSVSDSVSFTGSSENDSFSLSTSMSQKLTRYYYGDLKCKPDLGTNLLINTCDVEPYIAGVVKSEGGSERHPEYYKTQAVIARTYLYRHINKHALDGFNMCDDVHCQAFNGITEDTVITGATYATRGLVILGPDNLPILSAFHSNCGGETLSSENLWLTGQAYLTKIKDPYCTSSPNARWRKIISFRDWISFLKNSGLTVIPADWSKFNCSQKSRLENYRIGKFEIPFTQIRTGFSLRSSFFSVKVEGDSVILNGRGYGHGVGLCQEGAMAMALRGFDFRKIINFYYKGVTISDISFVAGDR